MSYKSILNEQETEHAIKLVKDTFQTLLSASLNLRRVTAPMFVEAGTGINDDLSGWETPVSFTLNDGTKCEVVHSLAKWKRIKLAQLDAKIGEGLYTDMNAIRPCENVDNLHSIYVDQWDWEKRIGVTQRDKYTLNNTVDVIYNCIKATENKVCEVYPKLEPFLPDGIIIIDSNTLATQYPKLTPKERENIVCKEYGAVFIRGIGGALEATGIKHDERAADYDDWELNGDILVWNPVLEQAFEISSMGIRVNAETLEKQLKIAKHLDWLERDYHKMVMNSMIPQTIGGGIGQSRLCMLLLHKMHIGEVQSSVWTKEERDNCQINGIKLL